MVIPLPKNPLSDFVAPRRNALMGLASGLLQGNDIGQGLGMGFERAAEGRRYDDAYAIAEKEKADRQNQINQTVQYLRQQPGGATWADRVEAGVVDSPTAFNGWLESTKSKGPIKASAGDVFLDPETMQPMYSVPEQQKPTASMQEYEFAKSQGYQGTFQQYETDMKKAGATNIDLNANQSAAAAYADRMAAANTVLDDPAITKAQTDLGQQAMGGMPVVGNFLTSKERQMADQAQRDFVNAILRRESGAVISPSEFENASKQYFPQPGDTPQVIEQKRQNRAMAIQGVVRAAGSNYTAPPAMGQGGVVDYTTYFGGQ